MEKQKIEIGVIANLPGRWIDVVFTQRSPEQKWDSAWHFLARKALRVEALRFMAWAEEFHGMTFDFALVRHTNAHGDGSRNYDETEIARLELSMDGSLDRATASAGRCLRAYAAHKVEQSREGSALWALKNLVHALDLDDLSNFTEDQRSAIESARDLVDRVKGEAKKAAANV